MKGNQEIRFEPDCYFCQNDSTSPSWSTFPDGQQICYPHADVIRNSEGNPPSTRAIIYVPR